MKRIVIIGSGNVAEALTLAFKDAGLSPTQIFARNKEGAAHIAAFCGCDFTNELSELAKADIYIIAVSDKAIKKVASQLDFGEGVVAHTAGSVGLDVFPAKVRNRAVFYPLQTFTKGRKVDFRKIPVLIEGSNKHSLESVREIASIISDTVMEVDSERRAILHIAAVFAGNFANHMYSVGEELASDAGFDFSILKPLIAEVADKAVSADSPKNTQTGPAVRNDFQTKSKHCDMLYQKPDLKNIYINLSKNIWETSKKT